jgi:hypothetical protein
VNGLLPKHVSLKLDRLHRQLLPHVGSIFIAPGPATLPREIIGGATATLLDTGARRMLITCHHVLQELRDQKKETPSAILALNLGDGNQTVELPDPENHLIHDQATPLDLVSFRYAGLCSPSFPEKQYLQVKTDHSPRVERGDYLVFVGFPGAFRSTRGCLVKITSMAIPLVVTDVSPSTIFAAADGNNDEVLTDMQDHFGGFSGSPVYLVKEQRPLVLVGFVRAWARLGGGCLMVSPSSPLQGDGTFSWPPPEYASS